MWALPLAFDWICSIPSRTRWCYKKRNAKCWFIYLFIFCFDSSLFWMFSSAHNEERNLLRLRAWEQRNQETSQAKEPNHETVPLFGEPYKVNFCLIVTSLAVHGSDGFASFTCKQQCDVSCDGIIFLFIYFLKLQYLSLLLQSGNNLKSKNVSYFPFSFMIDPQISHVLE